MAFVSREINTIFVLGEGDFGTQGQNTVEQSGLRTIAAVANAGGRSMGTAQLQIFGMRRDIMDKLTTLGMIATMQRKNSVTITAGDAGGVKATVFQGTITNAWMDADQAPLVPFNVIAHTGLFDAVQPAQPISIRGSADVAQLLSGLAVQMGVAFENNGVTTRLTNAYYPGSARQQAVRIVKAAGIEWNGAESGILAIWNPGQSRGGTVPLVSPETGMVGYPTYTANGIMLRTIWNPAIGLGTKIKVQSSQKPASGMWVVYRIDHNLEALLPGGQWFSSIKAAPPGLGPFVA